MLNFEEVGTPIAIIKDGMADKKIVYLAVSDDEISSLKKGYLNISLIKPGGKFEIIPNGIIEREIGYICGPSGSGKSFFAANYIDKYKKKHKKNDIFLFSKITDDEKINKFKPIRIKLDDKLIEDNFEPIDFQDSLVIFDDIDTIKDKKIKDEVYKILNAILQEGRHYKTSVLITNHMPTDREKTKIIFGEAHFITYFPFGGSQKQLKYMLEAHADLTKEDIKYNKASKSRWACIKKNFPPHTILEKEIYINQSE